MSTENKALTDVSKDIIMIINKATNDETLYDIYQKFFSIMRKSNIKKGTKTDNGIAFNNSEWSICEDMFIMQIVQKIHMDFIFTDSIPEDLISY